MAQAQEKAQETVLDEKEQAALAAKREVDELAKKAKVALEEFEKLNQEQVVLVLLPLLQAMALVVVRKPLLAFV